MNIKHTIKNLIERFIEWATEVPYRSIARNVLSAIGDFMHRALFTVLLPKRYRNLTKKQIFTIIFQSDTHAGKKFDVWLLILIGANCLVIMMESMAGATHWFSVLMRIVGWGFTILFTFEFYLRIYCLKQPLKYVTSFFGIIDILSIFPAYLSLLFPAVSTLSILRLMRLLRIFRIFKMQKFVDEGKFLINAIRKSSIKILIFMMFVFIIAIILGATIYAIEGDKNPLIDTIPKGIYWAVVTITTVGYGDIAPVTSAGRFISILVMLLGYSIIAVPTGIVAGETIEGIREQKSPRQRQRNLQPGDGNGRHSQQPLNQAGTSTHVPLAPSPEEEKQTDITPHHSPRYTWDDDPGARPNPEDLL